MLDYLKHDATGPFGDANDPDSVIVGLRTADNLKEFLEFFHEWMVTNVYK